MNDAQKKLLAISRTLTSLVKQVEKMAAALEKENAKAAPAKKAKAAVKKAKAKTKAKKAKAAPKKKAAKKAAPTAAKAKPAAAGNTMLDDIYGMISRSRNGITVERIKKRTGLQPRQVSNALYKLTKKGQIETLSRGVYVKKKK
jgi:membrane protein involved in colicin uptake